MPAVNKDVEDHVREHISLAFQSLWKIIEVLPDSYPVAIYVFWG